MASNIEVIEAFHRTMEEYWRTGDNTGLVAIFDLACVFSVPGMPDTLEGMLQTLPAFRQAFDDIAIRIGETVSEGDMIAYQMSFTGTHSGDSWASRPQASGSAFRRPTSSGYGMERSFCTAETRTCWG